uniref:BPTI/Kunitz inhibitor domain-containing protein n=1 Tax=Steinernema glaseri TaxID=37863 RepID=A0A1I7Z5A6_9BILA
MSSPLAFFLVVLVGSGSANSSRYEVCPNNGDPQKTREGNVVWCKKDSDCQLDYACIPIDGLTHFGVQINYCCPNRIAVCSLPPQPGYGECGRKPLRMFYFDVTSLQCKPFTVVECQGLNGNRFPSKAECKRRCEATACRKGESPLHLSSDLSHPVLCGESGLCPSPYKCRFDKLFRRHVCCGYKREGACPNGFRSYMNVLTGRPTRCRPNSVRDDCPSDFVCHTPDMSDVSYCCSKEKGVCPEGRSPYLHPLTDRSMKCHTEASLRSQCPFGYSCSASVPGSHWGFCCLDVVDGRCPQGTTPQLDATSNTVQCTMDENTCSPGYSCQNSTARLSNGICCSNRPSTSSVELSVVDKSPTPVVGSMLISTTPKAPAFRPAIRLVHIQKRIDKSEAKRFGRGRPRPQLRSFLGCPQDREPVILANSTHPQHCLPGVINKCPRNADCLRAPRDPLGRFVCCYQKEDDEDDIFKAKIQLSLRPSTISTKDPFCPTVLDGATCSPSRLDECALDGFFCQFNIELQAFACCTLSAARN